MLAYITYITYDQLVNLYLRAARGFVMGCDSPDSNFNNFFYEDGKWWAQSGYDYSYTAPSREILSDKLKDRIVDYNVTVSEANGTWTATPIPPPPKPVFDQLPAIITPESMSRPIDNGAQSGVWAGSRLIGVINIENSGTWHQPFIAVGMREVWHGNPGRDPEAAYNAALDMLWSAMRSICAHPGSRSIFR